MKGARTAALTALLQVQENEGYSNLVIDKVIRQASLDPRDAALATTIFYGVLERRIALDYWIAKFSKIPVGKLSPEVCNLLRMAVYQIRYLEKIPASAAVNEAVNAVKQTKSAKAAGYVNGVLRALLRGLDQVEMPDPQKDPLLALSVETSCPEWLIQLWEASYGKGCAHALVRAMSEKPPLFIRVNTTKLSVEDLVLLLEQEGVHVDIEEMLPGALRLSHTGAMDRLEAFQKGYFHVQDLSSQLCCWFLDPKPGEVVADVCAAPGGKTFTLAEWMQNQGNVFAFDLYKGKVGLIRKGAQRLGLSIVQAQVRDACDPMQPLLEADAVLCDAPCSGLGIIRRKPEIRYKNPKELKGLPDLQRQILAQAARQVRAGGRLLYSTCSLNPAENGEVATWFLQNHPDFAPLPLPLPEGFPRALKEPAHQITLMPHVHSCDGFFVSAFQRIH